MTTFDDQIPTNPVEVHDPARQENPFLLGTIFLRKLPGASGQTEITFSRVKVSDRYTHSLQNFSTEGGVFTLDSTGL